MLKGFRDFILRGNIIDLAVAVVIGTAFVPMGRLLSRYSKPAVEELALPSEAELLVEIRDLLQAQRRS